MNSNSIGAVANPISYADAKQDATESSNLITNSSDTNQTSVEEVSQLTLKLENLKSNYENFLPLFKETITKVEKLSNAKELTDLNKMGPVLDFNNSSSFTFIRWYVYLETQLLKILGKYNFELAFTPFEKDNSEDFANTDKTTLSMLTDVIWYSIKDAIGKRIYNSYSIVKYGSNYDNATAVSLMFNVIDGLSLFHDVRHMVLEGRKVEILLQNMEPKFKQKFLNFLLQTNFISSTSGDYSSSFTSTTFLRKLM
ncbi:hypothetical protein C6P42_000603, partial [Pichia californica]